MTSASKIGRRTAPEYLIVVLLPDSGRAYLSRIFNDAWMTHYGFLRPPGEEVTVAEVLAAKRGNLPQLVHVHPNEPVRDAIDVLREFGVSQLPVDKAEPQVVSVEVVGWIVVMR